MTYRTRLLVTPFITLVFFPALGIRASEAVRLETANLAVRIDAERGAITSITNKRVGGAKSIRSVPFFLTTTRGEVSPTACQLVRKTHDASSASFAFFSDEGLEIEITYQVESRDANAVRKLIKISNRGETPTTLLRLVVFDWIVPDEWPAGYPHSYSPSGIDQIHFHRSGIWEDHSINLFLRDDRGGLFMGVENPMFEAKTRALRKIYPSVIEVSYWPRWQLRPGDTFESDAGFVGVYRQEGIYSLSPRRVYFGGRERMPAEILDWGEVWAMQKYFESIMPPSDGPYYTAYWGKFNPGQLGEISRKKQSGKNLSDPERATLEHFGGGPFDFRRDEIWYRLTPRTAECYKQVVDDMNFLGHYQTLFIPNRMAGHSGWFASAEQKKEQGAIDAMLNTWFQRPAYPTWKEVADYAQERGIGMSTFLLRQPYRQDRTDWKRLGADGKRTEFNCQAHREFTDWFVQQIDKLLSTHSIRHLQWDEGWMGDVFGGKPYHCYDASHGHAPGDAGYREYREITYALETTKRRRPDVRFMIIKGLSPAMPWVMKHFEAETHTGAIMDQLGVGVAWYERNVMFLPSYKIRREGAVHWLIDRISSGVEADSGVDATSWYAMLEDGERRAAYKKNWDQWMGWIAENRKYLNVRRDLFLTGTPASSLRGTAHILGDRGFVFLHNSDERTIVGQIPVNHWLGLDEGAKERNFDITQKHPTTLNHGVYRWGETAMIPVASGATILLRIEPTSAALRQPADRLNPAGSIQKAFLELEAVIDLLELGDYWPATPLPGRENMPSF